MPATLTISILHTSNKFTPKHSTNKYTNVKYSVGNVFNFNPNQHKAGQNHGSTSNAIFKKGQSHICT